MSIIQRTSDWNGARCFFKSTEANQFGALVVRQISRSDSGAMELSGFLRMQKMCPIKEAGVDFFLEEFYT